MVFLEGLICVLIGGLVVIWISLLLTAYES
jgi:hypothetical protein